MLVVCFFFFFFFQAEDGIRDHCVTGVQTCALPISSFAEKPGVLELGGWAFHFCDGVLHGRLPILTAPGKSVRPATRGKRRLLVLCDGSKRRFDNAEAFSELLISDHERNENANHIVESSGGDGN